MVVQITEQEKDQLGEIVNIGAGNASTALSHMVGKEVGMTIPKVYMGSLEVIHQEVGSDSDLVVNVFLKLHGDIEGAMIMILSEESAVNFSRLLTGKEPGKLKDFDEKDLSAIQEVGNILLGASTTALSKFLDINVLHSVPDVAVDMLGSSLDEALVEMGGDVEHILLFEIDLTIEEDNMRGNLYFVFDPDSSRVILEKTKQKLGEQS